MNRTYYGILFFISIFTVFYLAVIPTDGICLPFHHADKIKHAFAFFILSFLLNRSSHSPRKRMRNMTAILMFGILIEIAQTYTPCRTPSVNDVFADAVGILSFQLLYSLSKIWQRNPLFTNI